MIYLITEYRGLPLSPCMVTATDWHCNLLDMVPSAMAPHIAHIYCCRLCHYEHYYIYTWSSSTWVLRHPPTSSTEATTLISRTMRSSDIHLCPPTNFALSITTSMQISPWWWFVEVIKVPYRPWQVFRLGNPRSHLTHGWAWQYLHGNWRITTPCLNHITTSSLARCLVCSTPYPVNTLSMVLPCVLVASCAATVKAMSTTTTNTIHGIWTWPWSHTHTLVVV